MNPRCCNQDAEWIVQGVRLQYWFCKECRNEVAEAPKDSGREVDYRLSTYAPYAPITTAPPLPPVVNPTSFHPHNFNAQDVCTGCGIYWLDWSSGAGPKFCSLVGQPVSSIGGMSFTSPPTYCSHSFVFVVTDLVCDKCSILHDDYIKSLVATNNYNGPLTKGIP